MPFYMQYDGVKGDVVAGWGASSYQYADMGDDGSDHDRFDFIAPLPAEEGLLLPAIMKVREAEGASSVMPVDENGIIAVLIGLHDDRGEQVDDAGAGRDADFAAVISSADLLDIYS